MSALLRVVRQKYCSISLVLCIGFGIFAVPSIGWAVDPRYDFPDDRNVTEISNLRNIEPASKYTSKQVQKIKDDMDVVKQQLQKIEEAVTGTGLNPKQKLDDIIARIEKIEQRIAEQEKRINQLNAFRENVIEFQDSTIQGMAATLNTDFTPKMRNLENRIVALEMEKRKDK